VVGAGVAGLSAATRLAEAGRRVVVHEATRAAGGRCRSYFDPALGMTIDNGAHLLLSGNRAALGYLARIGAGGLDGPDQAAFDFADLKSGERWRLRPNAGRLPWWLLDRGRRPPGARLSDFLAPLALFFAPAGAAIGEAMRCEGPLYERLLRPVLLAGLNIDPREGSAALAAATLRETLAAGGRACRPLVATRGLAPTFINPALDFLAARGATVSFGARLRGVRFAGERAVALDFEAGSVALDGDAALIVATPPGTARELLPGIDAPDEFRGIVNAHFRVAPPPGQPPILAVVNGLTEWLFAFPDRLSATISAADRLIDRPREELAAEIWRETAALTGLPAAPPPPWQIVKERRATFAATPAQNAKRPPARTRWINVALAGDWTRTGLPACIESAVRSGYAAATIVLEKRARASRTAVAAGSRP
jgi:squalene-associated FAD-dependent desaturase